MYCLAKGIRPRKNAVSEAHRKIFAPRCGFFDWSAGSIADWIAFNASSSRPSKYTAALGDRYWHLSEQALAQTDREMTRAYVELLIGIFSNGRGCFARAQERLERARAIYQRFGNGRRAEECNTNLFYLHLFRGEFAAAHAAAAQLSTSATRRADAQTLGWARTLTAHALLPTDGPAASLAMLGSSPAPNADALTRTAFHAGSAVALFRLGEKERAREHSRIEMACNWPGVK